MIGRYTGALRVSAARKEAHVMEAGGVRFMKPAHPGQRHKDRFWKAP